MKAKTHDYIENQLFAAVALLGIDEAIAILQRERERVVAALNGNREALRKMTVADFVEAMHAPVPRAQPRKATIKALPARPTETKDRMHAALKAELADGPQGIAKIVHGLKRRGVVNEVTPETKKNVMEFLAHDKTFSIRTRGVYAIRTRVAA